MNKMVKMFKSRIQLFLESDDVQGIFLFDEPLFEREGNLGVWKFEDPLERGFGFRFIDPAFFLPDLAFVNTLEVGVEKVVEGVENRVDGFQGGARAWSPAMRP
jgi:hypothetical protein